MDTKVENLIPHRDPMLFVDEVVSANEEKIIATKTFSEEKDKMLTGSFPNYGFVPGLIIIESMAQSGGAAIKQMNLADGFFGLVSMNDVQFYKGVDYGEMLTYKITNHRISNKIIKQSGVAFCNDEKVAEATWVCGRID